MLVFMKNLLHKTALSAERLWESARSERQPSTPYIDPFIGYATPAGVHMRGRVLNGKPVADLPADSSIWSNLLNMMARFVTRELPNMEVDVGGTVTLSDEEGYFSLDLPSPPAGTAEIEARLPGHDARVMLPLVTPHAAARFGVISDIDDTLIRTEAWSLPRNIWNTLTGNAASRQVFPDAVAFLEELHGGVNPVFYVSSSPWNLHGLLLEIFRRNGLIPGPLFLRDLGISEDKFIKGTHGAHKGAMIDKVLEANPKLDFVLLGDTGQHDPQVYHSAIERHPSRFTSAWFRAAGRSLDAEDRHWIDKIRALGVQAQAMEAFPNN